MNKFSVRILVLLPLLFGIASLGAQVTIGADAAPHSFSVLELVSKYRTSSETYGGLRLPQLTTAQRDGLGDLKSVPEGYGLMIYNTTINCVEYWNSKKWVSLCLGTANITLDGDCPPGHIFAADGSDVCTYIPEDEPPCRVTSGQAYQVYLTAGSAYATLLVDELTSAFTLSFSPNNSNYNRIAVVRVVNTCSGEYQDFAFTQAGAECPADVDDFSVLTSSTTLCGDNGAVIAWVVSPETGVDYVWAYGGQVVHTGVYMQITRMGTYTVYAGLLGCETPEPQSVTISREDGNSDGAPTLTATNGGILCSSGKVILTAGNVISGNDVLWFHKGALHVTTALNTLTIDDASYAGEWFVTQQNGDCGSKMSNIVNIQTSNNIALDPPIAKINGEDIDGDPEPVICKGGTLELAVVNPYPAGTVYEWFDGSVSIYKGNDPIIYPVAPNKDEMTLSVQVSNNSGGCPSTVVSPLISVTLYASPATTIGATAICGSAPAVLSALNNSGDTYEWFKDGVKVATTDGSVYNTSVPGSYTVRYKDDNDCWSFLSVAVNVVQSAAISLNWQTAPPNTVIIGSTETYTVLASPSDNVTYQWTNANPTLATITQMGNTASIDFLNLGTDTITVAATNVCGTALLEAEIEIVSGCSPIPGVSITPPGPVTRRLYENGTPYLGQGSTTFTATGATSATQYEWFENSTSQQNGTSNSYTYLTPTSPGSYTVSVEASNECSSKTAAVTVNVSKDNPADSSGNYRIGGKTCYDVYVTNWGSGNSCMPLASRTDDFGNGYTFVYNFINATSFSGLTWEIDDPESLVASFTSSGSNNELLSVTFKSDAINGVKTKAKGTNKTTALKVTLTAKYTDNLGDLRQVQLNIFIQDCSCGCAAKKSATEWITFMCYNLGADPTLSIAEQMAYTPNPNTAVSADVKVYGWLYQWGRRADGHQQRNSKSVNGGINPVTVPYDANSQIPVGFTYSGQLWYGNHVYLVNGTGVICDWHGNSLANRNDDLWNYNTPLGQSNNPCPAGWRIPTQAEWAGVMNNNVIVRPSSTIPSTGTNGLQVQSIPGTTTLFLPAAGYRASASGTFNYTGTFGTYWSNTPSSSGGAYNLTFTNSDVSPNKDNFRANGFSIRCVAEQ